MESQIILLLVKIASLGKSQICCASYLSNRGHQKLILTFFRGSSQISLLHGNIFKEVVEKIIDNHWGRLIRLNEIHHW